jgi:serine phosphatase RsbU (regulator of sigma subunit)
MKSEMVPATSVKSLSAHECVLKRRLGTSCDEAGRELEAVAAAQQLLLPAELPHVPGLDLAVSYRPARQAGGDFYDFLPLTDGRWGLFIADVSGHGAAAAIVTAVVHATLRGAASTERRRSFAYHRSMSRASTICAASSNMRSSTLLAEAPSTLRQDGQH